MNQPASRKIDFRKQRDFSAIFSDSFKYMKFNFKTLALAVIVFAGPLLMIAGGLNGYLQSIGSDPSKIFGLNGLRNPMDAVTSMLTVLLPYLIVVMLAMIVFSAVVNRYLILSQQKSEGESVSIADLVKYLPKDCWRLFYNYLLLTLVGGLLLIVIVLIALIPILGIVLIILGLLLAGPNLSYAVRNASYLVLRDEISILTAFSKTMRYMRGHWWSTWAILFCSSMIVGIASIIFTLPQIIYTMIDAFSKLRPDAADSGDSNSSFWFILFAIIAMLGQYILMPMVNIFCTLTYHSHEEEEEGTGLKSKIEEIGLNN